MPLWQFYNQTVFPSCQIIKIKIMFGFQNTSIQKNHFSVLVSLIVKIFLRAVKLYKQCYPTTSRNIYLRMSKYIWKLSNYISFCPYSTTVIVNIVIIFVAIARLYDWLFLTILNALIVKIFWPAACNKTYNCFPFWQFESQSISHSCQIVKIRIIYFFLNTVICSICVLSAVKC